MDGIGLLHDLIVKAGYYSKSVDEFRSQIKDPEYRAKVESVLQKNNLLTDDIKNVLSSGETPIAPDPLKKKGQTMESSSEGGSLVSQGLPNESSFDLYQSVLKPKAKEKEEPIQSSFDFYAPLREKKQELPKSFQDIDYSEGIGTPSGIQNLFGQVKTKLKEAPIEDIEAFGNIMSEKSKKGEDVLTGYNQSSLGKVNELISSIKGGEEISPDEVEYLKSRSPKAYNELLSFAPSGKQVNQTDVVFEPAKDVNEVARRIKSGNDELFTKGAHENLLSVANQLQTFGVDVSKIGNVSTRGEMDKIQSAYNAKLKELQAQYPEERVGTVSPNKDFGGQAVLQRAKEYYEKLQELDGSKEYILSGIAKVHAAKYALANPNASSLAVGAEVLKIIDPTRYNNYIKGNSVSTDVQEDMDRLGYEVLKSTGNSNLIKKGIESEKMHNDKYPNELIEETKKRIAIEYAKDKGMSYVYNPESLTIAEADKYIDQLPAKYRNAYLNKIRPSSINLTYLKEYGDELRTAQLKPENAYMQIPSMGGAVNKFFSGIAMPFKGGLQFIADRVNPEETVINNALKKDYGQLNVDEASVKSKIKELQSKGKLSIEDAKELEKLKGELGTQIPLKNFVDGTAELTGQVLGQALMTELGAAPLNAGLKSVSFGSKMIGLTDKAAQIAKLSADVDKIKTISAGFTSGISSYSDAQKEAINLGLDGWKQNLYSGIVAGLNVATEHIFPDHKVFEVFMKDTSPIIAKMVRDMSSKNVTQAALSSDLKRVFLSNIPKYLKNFATENQKEAFEEVATQLGTSIAKGLLAPEKTNISDEAKAIQQTWLETTIYGGVTSALAAKNSTKANSISSKLLYQLGNNEKAVNQFVDVVNRKVSDGSMTQQEADAKIKGVRDIQQIVQNSIPEIDKRKPMTDAEKIKLSSILLAERKLKEDINNPQLEDVKSLNQKDLSKVVDLKEKILNDEVVVDNDLNAYTQEEYNQKVKQDAIQEQTAGEVPVQPTAGVGEKVEEGVPEPKPVLTPEQKSEKEDRQLKLEKAIEVAPEDATEVKVDEEVIPIGDAKNELETIKVELQPPAITQEEQAATEKKLAKEEKMKTTTFMDEDGNERTIEGNELMFSDLYEEAVSTPEKERTDYQNSILDAMDEVSLETPIQMHDEQQANEFEQKVKEPLHKLVASQAKNVISTLKSMMPNLEFNIHEDEDSYNGNMVRLNGIRGSRGNFSVDKNGKLRIDINLSKVNKLTVFHEAAHAVMYHTFGENYKAFKFFHNKLASAISSMGDQDFIGGRNEITTTKKYLNNFISRYKDKKVRPEEYMVELGSMLSNNAIKLSVDGWRKIALAIREFVKEKTGGKINLFKNINDTKEVVDFFNSMAESFKTGEAMKQAPESFVKRFGKGEKREGSSSSLKDEIDVKAIRLKDRPGKKVSKGLSVYQKNGKKIIEESEDLSIEYVKKNAPEVFISNSNILASFPLVAGVKKFGEIKTVEQAQEVYDIFTNQIAENLKFLMNNYPEKYRDISTLWYDGANIIAQNESKENDITVEQAAGIIASLSPQKDWYQNVRLAQLVGMAFKENPPMTDKMIEKQKSIVKEGLKPKQKSLEKAQEKYKKSKSNKNLKALEKQKKAYLKYINSSNEIIDALTSYLGKNLNDVPDYIKPYMVRLHHEINTSKDYRVLRPDGVPMDFALKKDGKTRAKLAWGSYSEIGKAVSIYLNGSPENITRALGEMHKIRNFNNNIVDPMSEDYDVTMDTHAIAAALLMPLSGNSKQVEQNFGKDTSNSDLFGIKGLYYAYAEGYKKAAQDVGLLPRQVQSITWEAVRGLFTDVFKRNKDEVEKINKIWSNYENKKITIDEAREQIIESAGGINPPTWSAEGGGLVQEGVGENVEKGSVRRGGEKPKRNTVGDKSGGAGKRGVTKSKAQISQEDKRLVQTISKSSLVGSRAKLAESIMRDKEKAIKLEKLNMPANEIRLITNWEKGADGKWRYELDSSKSKMKLVANSKDDLRKEHKLSDVISYPELFKAYPELKDVKIGYSKFDHNGIPYTDFGAGYYDPYDNKVVIGYTDDIFARNSDTENAPKFVIDIAKKEIKLDAYAMSLEEKGIEPYSHQFMDKIDKYEKKLGIDRQALVDAGYGTIADYGIFEPNQKYQNIILDLGAEDGIENSIHSVLLHEIQHAIQDIEDFARGGNATMAIFLMSKDERKEYEKNIAKAIQIDEDVDEGKIELDDLTFEQRKIYYETASKLAYKIYKRISGEIEARNVQARMKMSAEERRRTPLTETEDTTRDQHRVHYRLQSKSKSQLAEATEKDKKIIKDVISKSSLVGMNSSLADDILENRLKAIAYDKIGMPADKIRLLTGGWEKGVDGNWSYELDSSKMKMNTKHESDLNKKYKLSDIISYPKLFEAYPSFKDINVVFFEGEGEGEAYYDETKNEIGLGYNKSLLESRKNLIGVPKVVIDIAKQVSDLHNYESELYKKYNEYNSDYFKEVVAYKKRIGFDPTPLINEGYATYNNKYGFVEYDPKFYKIINTLEKGDEKSVVGSVIKSSILHEVQHAIQEIEDWPRGGNRHIAIDLMTNDEQNELYRLYKISQDVKEKINNAGRKFADLTPDEIDALLAPDNFVYGVYKRIAGETQSRNVQARMNMTAAQRLKTSLTATEDVPRGKQIISKAQLAEATEKDKKIIKDVISKSSLVGMNSSLADDILENRLKAIAYDKIGMPADKIRLLTGGWEKDIDGNWTYEIDSSKMKMKVKHESDLNKKYKLSDIISYPKLFEAYPSFKDINVVFFAKSKSGGSRAYWDEEKNELGLGYDKSLFESRNDLKNIPKVVLDIAKKAADFHKYDAELHKKYNGENTNDYFKERDAYKQKIGLDPTPLVDEGYATYNNKYGFVEYDHKFYRIINTLLRSDEESVIGSIIKSEILHEVQHAIQEIEDWPRGGNESIAKDLMTDDEYEEYIRLWEIADNIENEMNKKGKTITDLSWDELQSLGAPDNFVYEVYRRIAGEAQSRNVEARVNMTAAQRLKTPLTATEDVPREMQLISKAQLTEEELPGYDDMMSEVKNIIEKVLKRQMDRLGKTISRNTNLDNAKYRKERLDAAINYVMQDSKIYADADDVQREQIIRDIRKLLKFKEKSAPGNKSELFMGIGRIIKMAKKEKMVTMTAYKLLLKEMNALARGARDARVAMNKSRNYIADSLRFYVRSGQLSSRQAAAILRMYSKTNLLKPESVERLIGYMVKVFRDADYAQKLSTANSLRSKIVQQMKDKTKSPDLRAMAMKFANIETSLVEDIDEYNKVASNLLSGISGSKKRGEKINWAEGVDLLGLSNYINNTMESQNKQKRDMLENEMKVIMGLDTSDMPYGDLNMFNNDDSEQEKSIAIAKKLNQFGVDTTGMTYKQMRSSLIKETIKRAFGINLDDGTYPGSFSNEQKKTMKDFLDSDLDNLSDKEAMDAVNKLTAEMKGLNYIDLSDMSYEELKAVMEGDKEEETNEEKKKKRGIVSKIIDDIVKRAFSVNSSVISSMIENGKDPLTGDPVDFTEKQKDILKRFMDMDLDLLSEKQRIEAVDKLNLFVQNQGDYRSTAGMESILAVHDAEKNLRTLAEEGVYAHVIRKYFSPRMGRLLLENIVSVPMMFERLFKGVTRGAMVQDMSGTTDMINGKAKAERMSRKMDTAYVLKFFKKKPNGESFNTAKNNIERGMGAYMMRNIVGTEEEMRKEFERRRGIIEKSIALLEQGDDNEKQKAEMYQEAYDKIVKDSKNIGDIKSKIDPTNLEAIEWWSSMWDEHYEEMAGVTANVYNQILEKDINYNPDRFKVISTDRNPAQLTSNKSIFNFNNGTMYRQEAGSLKTPLRSSALPVNEESGEANRYIDFSFDNNNSNAMYDALVDINTAAAATKLNAFIDSKNFGKLFKSSKDKDIVRDRLIMMANNMRNKSPFTNRGEAEKLIHSLNRIASVGVGQALGGISQPLKQMGPVALNTLINAGGLHLGLIFDPKRMDFINRSGYAIANRGSEASTQIASLNKIIKEAAESKGEKAIRLIEKANRLQLEIFLVQPDVYIAKASWLAFYEQSLKKQGIKTVYYDVNHLNKKAADYAQTMVDRQQNISDHDLAGKLYSESGNDYKSLFIKLFLGFSSFRMNTSARLANDLSVLEYWNTSTKEDKIIAMRSLAGYAVETASFRYLSLLVSGFTSYLALMARGRDEDDEEEEKRKKNAFKGQATTGVVELLSPFPLLDKAVQLGVYHTLELLQSGTDEKDKINIYNVKNAEDFVSGLGLFGIAATKALQIWELGKLSSTGEFVDDYGKTRYIKQDDRDIANALIYPTLLAGLGIIPPAEIKSITDKTIKGMKKDASTNNPNEWTADEEKYLDELNQLDYIYKNYDLSDEEKDYIGLKMDERRLQINPERDLKMEKRVREEQKKEKELSKSLLEGYADREQMKRKDPALYKQNFGKQSEYYQDNLAERRVNKIWKKVKKGWD